MSYGIDTIKVSFFVDSSQIDFDGWSRTKKTRITESEDMLIKDFYIGEHTLSNGTYIFMKYIHKDYQGKVANLLIFEFSLPKLSFGCNYLDITDLDTAMNLANDAIAEIPGIPELPDIRKATLHRIDLCANFQVGDDVTDYIQALGKAHLSHRTLTCYSDHGVQFKASEISSKFYDKEKECGSEEAYGILRFEISILKQRKIKAYLGADYCKLETITFDRIYECINDELTRLHLDKPLLSERSKVESILSSVYTSKAKVAKLVGYWSIRQTMTREQMLSAGYTKNLIHDYERELTKAGIAINGNLGRKELPALTPLLVEMEENHEEAENCHNVPANPSDTRNIARQIIEEKMRENKLGSEALQVQALHDVGNSGIESQFQASWNDIEWFISSDDFGCPEDIPEMEQDRMKMGQTEIEAQVDPFINGIKDTVISRW